MIKTRTRLLALAGIVLIVVLGIVFLRKVHYVDPKPAIAFGQNYFTKLQENQVNEAFAMYTDGFSEAWRRLEEDTS